MSVNKVLKEVLKDIEPNKEAISEVKKFTNYFISELKKELDSIVYGTQIFIGGSFAKNTLIKKEKYDVDIFVRFDWKYDDLSRLLEEALKKSCKNIEINYEVIHGSRNYFRVFSKTSNAYLEVIPVTKIKRPREARNVTDLSYFHVSYVKRNTKGIEGEIRLAKKFMEAQRVYGAESYVQGFSGYALECLIIHYRSFVKMLKELVKVKNGERLIIDTEKHYKRKNDVLLEINESKLHSPIIVVDPTYKERNALASLSQETLEKFQNSARRFLEKPSKSFFEEQKIKVDKLESEAKRVGCEFLKIELKTDRQEGDVAGTKMKKFVKFLELELKKYFKVEKVEFDYSSDKGQESKAYFIVKSRGEIIRIGPPVWSESKKRAKMFEKHVKEFKRQHKKTYEKKGVLHANIKVNFTAKEFLESWTRENKHKIKDMGIVDIKIDK